MRLTDIKNNDYFKLFVYREGKVVLGKHFSNLWLLCSVLFVTFLAIAFSNASLGYLEFKMNDPFINWVDITNSGDSDFNGFQQALHSEKLREEYNYRGFQSDKSAYITFCTDDNMTQHLDGRYFEEINTPLVQKILEEENLVENCCIDQTKLDNNSFGIIITEDALRNKLRYTKIPAFVNYYEYCDPRAERDYGVEVLAGKFAAVPVPILAVVKRLPNSKDYIGTKFYLRESRMHRSMNLIHPEYHQALTYFIPKGVDAKKFLEELESLVQSKTTAAYFPLYDDAEFQQTMSHMVGFAEGEFLVLVFLYEDEIDYHINSEINKEMLSKWGSKGVYRVYKYKEHSNTGDITDDYISVHFSSLDKIGAFQQFAKEKFSIDIDMSQINAKENFNAVSIMANVLSWTMIVFAIVCIILFIVNLLQSYFQKVKRNLGTFKAFGISNGELIMVYVLIMMTIIVAAIFVSLFASWFVQGFMWILGLEKDGGFGYLDLWSGKTIASIFIIVLASAYTVYVVMRNLLKDTPGDLIYDR